MITIADRQFNKLCQISFGGSSNLVAYDDKFMQPKDSDLSSYFFRVGKTSLDIEKISVGALVYVQDEQDIRVFEIVRIESINDELDVYCIDAGLDFINEEKGSFAADNSYPITYYVDNIRFDSGWEIGVNEISNTITRKLSYDSTESSVSRLRKVATAFNAEIEYTFDLSDTRIIRRLINIYKKGTRAKRVRLEYGYEVSKITKTESIETLATALHVTGEEVDLRGFNVPQNERNTWRVHEGVLIHLPSTKQWSRHGKNKDYDESLGWGYILAYYESTAKTKETLYQAAKQQLLKRCYPEITYEVDVVDMPERVRRGDIVEIVDHDFMPAITIRGRVASVDNVSFIDKTVGTITITNIEETRYVTDSRIERLQEQLKSQVQNWNNTPLVMLIDSSNGTTFTSGNITTTLTAKVSKNSIDVTGQYTNFKWERVSRYDTSKDAHWNQQHTNTTRSIQISNEDVDNQATFFCYAMKDGKEIAVDKIVIKDLTISTHKGVTAPNNPETGMLWIDISSDKEVQKIYLNGEWVVVSNQADVSQIISSLLQPTEEQIRLLKEQSSVLKAELEARALLEELNRVKEAYEAYVLAYQEDKHASEEALRNATSRIALLQNNLGDFSEQWNFFKLYANISDDGFILGNNTADTSFRLTDNRISMYSGGAEVMYITQGVLHIDNGIFTKTIQIGRYRFEQYALDADKLVLRYMSKGVNE
ncbi:phage tail protein [Carnobacteriaceae bacterium zg-ZUI240]|nr:phage tail protein [Carnobacteriaceae bacterium zg-ZUI240]